ncbi:LysM peptidoglycan-binding domain-containing protein [Vibrio sp. TRT 1302]|uniref:LysM peptidoglycan-binding domain-containing protein n=1 Tax=Vibrio sp. TRT 1302 TaxID=3418504 RepID=UPI003CFA059F
MNYTIQSGDTLSAIARANGITVKALHNANPSIADPNKIDVGEVIHIPQDAVLVSGTADPATNAAIVASVQPVDNVVEDCPLRDEWFTVKPMRYAVADSDSSATLPERLSVGVDLAKMQEHHYIARELIDHTVYLYNEDEQYLIEVLYQDGIAQDARCVFGEIPAEVESALPILKQKQNTKATMWLSVTPLSQLRLSNLQTNPDTIVKLGQRIDFAQAAAGNAPDTRPLYDIENLLANTQVVESFLKWTFPELEPISDINGIRVPYEAQTPKNNYAVCLVDAVGIATDLCREFSIAYELTMSSLSTSQHPLQMAKLTKHILDNEMAQAASKVPEYQSTGQYAAALSMRKRSDEQMAQLKTAAGSSRKQQLEKYLHVQEMESYLQDYQDAMPKLKQQLETLSEDWLTWLEHEQLDIALSWLDDSDKEQIALKESLLFAMTNNLEATDQGVALAQRWSKTLLATVSEQPKQEKGAGAHFLAALGFAKPLVLEGSKWLKELNGTTNSNSSIEAMAKVRNGLIKSGDMPATIATDGLINAIASPLVQLSMESNAGILWQETYTLLTYRYDYQFPQLTSNLGDVMFDIEASYAVMVYTATGHITNAPQHQTSTQTVNLYAVNQTSAPGSKPSAVEKHAQYWLKQVNGNDLLSERTTLMKLYRKTEQVFTPNVQNTAVGLFFLVQVYNTSQVNSQFSENPLKYGVDRANAWVGLITSSFAVLDQFAGARFGEVGGKKVFTQFMQEGGADLLGKSTAKSLTSLLSDFKLASPNTIDMFERLGNGLTKIVKITFRWLPVVGGTVAALASGYQLGTDLVSNQNALATAVSGLTLLVNGMAAYCAWVALVPAAAPVMAVAAVVLGVTALTLDIVRASLMDDKTQLFLKGSFWGRGDYAYGKSKCNTLEQRLMLFGHNLEQQDAIKVMQQELTAFGDFLFKPIPQLINVSQTGEQSRFTLQILLPGFVPLTSDVSVYLQGFIEEDTKDLLVSHSQQKRWQTNLLNGKMSLLNSNTAILSFEVDEAELATDYRFYQLALAYHNPAGYPVSLKYPKIIINDDKQWFEFWRSSSELESFEIEKNKL